MILNKTLFVLDTETGGIDLNVNSLMEIGGVVLRDGEIIDTYSSLIKSPNEKYNCSDFARKLHGISDEAANKYGKLPNLIIQDLVKIRNLHFNGSPMTIVAHNAAFDIGFVKKMFADYANETENFDNVFARNSIDTATMALILRLQDKLPFDRCSLDNILQFYDIKTDKGTRHSALNDCFQTTKAFLRMFDDLSSDKTSYSADNLNLDYEEGFDDLSKYDTQGGAERDFEI